MTTLVFKRRTEPLRRVEPEPEVAPAREPAKEPDHMSAVDAFLTMQKAMNGTLDYLQKTPKEQAQHEADEFRQQTNAANEKVTEVTAQQKLLEGELAMLQQESATQMEQRGELESQISGLQEKLAVPRSDPKEMGKLRGMLRDMDVESGTLRQDVSTRDSEIALLKESSEKARGEFEESLKVASNKPPQIIKQLPVKPENIDFVYHREMNGLLSRVVLQAEGYDDVEVGIVRGMDGRMKHLKIGDTQ